MKKLSYILVTLLSVTFPWVSGTDSATVEIVQTDTSSFGGCSRSAVNVVFEELLSETGTVYKRAVFPAPEECLLGFNAVDSKKHNLKTCLEAAAKDGYNMFMLDGETCQVTNSKVRKDVADSDNLVTLYAVEMFEPGDVITDTSLSFDVKDIERGQFTVDYSDVDDCIEQKKSYEVRVNGEKYEVTTQDTETIDSNVDLPPCVEIEFVFARIVEGVQVGQALSKTMKTYQALPDDFPGDLTFTASGKEVIVSWDYTENCWGILKGYTVKVTPKDAMGPEDHADLEAEDTSFTVSDCEIMGLENKFEIAPTLSDEAESFTPEQFSLGEMALKEVAMPLDLTDITLTLLMGEMVSTKATFTGEDCTGDATFHLKLIGPPDAQFYELDSDMATDDLLDVIDSATYVLQRQIDGSQVGPTSEFLYNPS